MRIMIVDDNELMRKEIFKSVAQQTDTVLECDDGETALSNCVDFKPDWILMDIRMPGMNGYEAIRRIRKFNKEVIIIAQTAFALSGDREKAMDAGCNDYIAKPIKKEELIKLVKKYFNV